MARVSPKIALEQKFQQKNLEIELLAQKYHLLTSKKPVEYTKYSSLVKHLHTIVNFDI